MSRGKLRPHSGRFGSALAQRHLRPLLFMWAVCPVPKGVMRLVTVGYVGTADLCSEFFG